MTDQKIIKLDDIEQMPGSAQLKARYIHVGKWDFKLGLIFKDGSGRKFLCTKQYRTLTALVHDWHHNQYKFYDYEFIEVK